MSFLTLTDVRKVFGDHVAVADFALSIARGEFVSFLGPSGCGKTTTLRMIAGFELPTSGRIELDGTDITNRPPNRRDVGMVFQSYALFPNMTVADNISFGMRVKRLPRDASRKRVTELLELIHMPDAGPRYPWQLSGGMQQRVALARALAIQPQVLLLDEPLSALDAKIRVALRAEIRAIQQQLGITTVYVTHDQEEALSLSDRVVVMSHGRIEQVGSPAAIYNSPATEFVARFVGTLNVLRAEVVDAAGGRVRIGSQEVRTGRSLTAAAGTQVALALRPEAVTIAAGSAAMNDVDRLSGSVADVMFLGSIVRVRVRLADEGAGDVLLDRFNDPGAVPPARGDAVTVAFSPDALVVIEATTDAPADPVIDDIAVEA
jgi:putative spermidine/putrescine transport system ATP-binding protein